MRKSQEGALFAHLGKHEVFTPLKAYPPNECARAELQRGLAAGEFEFQMTVSLPKLYDLLDSYAATVQEVLESNAVKFVGN